MVSKRRDLECNFQENASSCKERSKKSHTAVLLVRCAIKVERLNAAVETGLPL